MVSDDRQQLKDELMALAGVCREGKWWYGLGVRDYTGLPVPSSFCVKCGSTMTLQRIAFTADRGFPVYTSHCMECFLRERHAMLRGQVTVMLVMVPAGTAALWFEFKADVTTWNHLPLFVAVLSWLVALVAGLMALGTWRSRTPDVRDEQDRYFNSKERTHR